MSSRPTTRSLTLAVLALAATAAVACGPAPTPPRLRAPAITVAEGAGAAVVAVTSSAPSTRPVTVAWATSPSTALPGRDYLERSGTLTIPAGATRATISVPLVADTMDEHDERFQVELRSASGATISDPVGFVDVTDDDAPPGVSLLPGTSTVVEGQATTNLLAYLSEPSGKDVSVRLRTVDGADRPFTGAARAPEDYRAIDEVLTIRAGSRNVPFFVRTAADALDEGRGSGVGGTGGDEHDHESLTVVLSEPVDASLQNAVQTVQIQDDDAPPSVSVLDARTVVEGDVDLGFTVQLSAPSGRNVDVRWETADDTAEAGSDYVGGEAPLRIAPGQTSVSVPVRVLEDECRELAEDLVLRLVPLTYNPVADGSARGRITDDGDPEAC